MKRKIRIPIKIIDVFTTRPFEGNAAGVILNSLELTTNDMQKIARELNISNTAFISDSKKNGDVKIRFFTPEEEIDICGHSTIGTFFAWGEQNLCHLENSLNIVQMETNFGILPVYIKISNRKVDFVTITLPNPKFKYPSIEKDRILRALNILEDKIVSEFPIEIVYDGLSFLEIGIKDRKTLFKVKPSFNDLLKISKELKIDSIQIFTLDTIYKDSTVHSRTFFPSIGVNEDPVCGTGNGAIASYLIKNKLINILKPTIKIIGEQGFSMSRPGIVTVLIDFLDNKIQRLRIRGKSIEILKGNIYFKR